MCPAGIATVHPAGDMLAEWSQLGCPTKTGMSWSKPEMWEAVAHCPHQSSLSPEALAHFTEESIEKVQAGQAKLVTWDNIKDDPPAQLKILPIAAISHKPKAFRSILDLSFCHQLKLGGILDLVNDATVKLAPQGALDQLGHALSWIIHAFAKSDENTKIFMAKWDIKDGFWQMDCEAGKEYSFAYVLPQNEGMQTTLIVPTSLQMGWVESLPYFCAATETARDIASDNCNTFLHVEQGLHFDTKSCCFGTTQTIPSFLVKYSPHAVLLLSLTILDPVARLERGGKGDVMAPI
jgi:hypothetical protein